MAEKMSKSKAKTPRKPIVEMKNIHKWFGEVHALRGVDFQVFPFEVVGLIGDNGAGKSTLIKILTGLIPSDDGKIFYKGKEVKISSVKEARKLGIETVYQEQAIVNPLSVAKNVFLGREKTKSILMGKVMDDETMIHETEKLMRRLNLDIASPKQEAQFCSGGERQGVAIARAMYFGAKILILDEPTRALSISGVEKVQNYVREVRNRGTGVVYITHNLQQVYPIADRFVFLSRGEKKASIKKGGLSLKGLADLYRR